MVKIKEVTWNEMQILLYEAFEKTKSNSDGYSKHKVFYYETQKSASGLCFKTVKCKTLEELKKEKLQRVQLNELIDLIASAWQKRTVTVTDQSTDTCQILHYMSDRKFSRAYSGLGIFRRILSAIANFFSGYWTFSTSAARAKALAEKIKAEQRLHNAGPATHETAAATTATLSQPFTPSSTSDDEMPQDNTSITATPKSPVSKLSLSISLPTKEQSHKNASSIPLPLTKEQADKKEEESDSPEGLGGTSSPYQPGATIGGATIGEVSIYVSGGQREGEADSPKRAAQSLYYKMLAQLDREIDQEKIRKIVDQFAINSIPDLLGHTKSFITIVKTHILDLGEKIAFHKKQIEFAEKELLEHENQKKRLEYTKELILERQQRELKIKAS